MGYRARRFLGRGAMERGRQTFARYAKLRPADQFTRRICVRRMERAGMYAAIDAL
jgi:hypothetical protein